MKSSIGNAAKSVHSPLVAGVLTGQAAGLIMAAFLVISFTFILYKAPLYPIQLIGSVVFGERALQGVYMRAIFVGLLLHQLGPCLVWGLVFGALAGKFRITRVRSSMALGLAVGAIAMIGPYFVIPALMEALSRMDYWNLEMPLSLDWIAHGVFGLSLGFYPGVRKPYA